MKIELAFVIFCVVVFKSLAAPILTTELVNTINAQANVKWQAGMNDHFLGWSLEDAAKLCGVKIDRLKQMPRIFKGTAAQSPTLTATLPEAYDVRDAYGTICPSVNEVRDQGACGSCWAVSVAAAITDRICIATNGSVKVHISASDLLSCCNSCGNGCDGGFPDEAFSYWVSHGIVSGGEYNSSEGCMPYPLPQCEHHVNGTRGPCGDTVSTPACKATCVASSGLSYLKDKYYGASAYTLGADQQRIKQELYSHGPLEISLEVYADFLAYKSGVYHHTNKTSLGGHAVKLVGWGVDKSTPYWTIANSWNTDWGDKGFFKILRGSDESSIESSGPVAGMPKIPSPPAEPTFSII